MTQPFVCPRCGENHAMTVQDIALYCTEVESVEYMEGLPSVVKRIVFYPPDLEPVTVTKEIQHYDHDRFDTPRIRPWRLPYHPGPWFGDVPPYSPTPWSGTSTVIADSTGHIVSSVDEASGRGDVTAVAMMERQDDGTYKATTYTSR